MRETRGTAVATGAWVDMRRLEWTRPVKWTPKTNPQEQEREMLTTTSWKNPRKKDDYYEYPPPPCAPHGQPKKKKKKKEKPIWSKKHSSPR